LEAANIADSAKSKHVRKIYNFDADNHRHEISSTAFFVRQFHQPHIFIDGTLQTVDYAVVGRRAKPEKDHPGLW
jgi:hypothetical protein